MTGPSTPSPWSERTYRGVTQADCLRQASDDGVKARAAGYVPISQAWSEDAGVQVLTVIYEQQATQAFSPGRYPIGVRIDRDRSTHRLWVSRCWGCSFGRSF